MRHRWGSCGEQFVLAVAMAVAFGVWLGLGAEKVMAGGSGFERASYSAGPVRANFILGTKRAPAMTTAGWSLCWRSAEKADGRCLDIKVAWGPVASAFGVEDLAFCVGARCDQLKMKSQ